METQKHTNQLLSELKILLHHESNKSINKSITISMIGIAASVISFFSTIREKELPISAKISEVEKAIAGLKTLDEFLQKTKSEMIQTAQAKAVIEQEYAKSKELEKLTQIQLEAISSALHKKSRFETILNYFWGAIIGISTSIIGSVIYGRYWKKV